MAQVEIARRQGGRTVRGNSFGDIFPDFVPGKERWLFVSPHDDDIVIGAGLLLQQALAEGVKIDILITTDGSLGYITAEQQADIQEIRRKETEESFSRLGIDSVRWLNFPDAGLAVYQGRRVAREGDPAVIAGFTGLENAYATVLREVRPDRVFVPGEADYHLDHKIVYRELLISLYHAAGGIWPELGEPLGKFPALYEMAIYCDFAVPPDIQIRTPAAFLEKKLDAIRAYESQVSIIDKLVKNIEETGPVEYFKDFEFSLYEPKKYADLFT